MNVTIWAGSVLLGEIAGLVILLVVAYVYVRVKYMSERDPS